MLGSDTRIGILKALGEAPGPLSFSTLRESVGVGDSGRFNYHLDKLEGTFVAQTEEGYVLLESGRRVVEAIFSGVLTDDPAVERIHIDRPCSYCGAPIEVRVSPGAILSFCTQCPGSFGESTASGTRRPAERGYLGKLALPPAGFQDRTPEEIYEAAQVWGHLELLSVANGVCPRCSARLEHELEVCADHAVDEDLCAACGNRRPVMVDSGCTNCIFRARGDLGIMLYAHPAVQAFKVGHGHNLVAPEAGANPLSNRTDEILSAEPFAAVSTYEYEGDTLVVEIDDSLTITDVTDRQP